MFGCKASEIPRNEAHPAKGGTAMTLNEDNPANGGIDGRFPTAPYIPNRIRNPRYPDMPGVA